MARLIRFDPRRRLVICATALVGSREWIVGIGAIDLVAPGEPHPDTVVVDAEQTEGLDELLTRALLGRASAIVRSRAA